jgi:hypothetical protein
VFFFWGRIAADGEGAATGEGDCGEGEGGEGGIGAGDRCCCSAEGEEGWRGGAGGGEEEGQTLVKFSQLGEVVSEGGRGLGVVRI